MRWPFCCAPVCHEDVDESEFALQTQTRAGVGAFTPPLIDALLEVPVEGGNSKVVGQGDVAHTGLEAHKRFDERFCTSRRQLDIDDIKMRLSAGTQSSLDLGAKEHIDPEEGLRRVESVHTMKGRVEEKYKQVRKLGEGSYGLVMEVTARDDAREHFAVKVISMKNLKDSSRFAKELAVARRLKHPHIIRLFESFQEGDKYHLVMEFSDGGDLFERVQKTRRKKDGCPIMGIGSMQVATYAWQMLTGIAYLHHYSFAHRDVKPANYLVDKSGSSLKLVDFGLARSYTREEKMTTRVGTPQYVAPEVVNNKIHSYGAKCDVWSIAVTLWYLSVGELPFVGVTQQDLLKQVVSGAFRMRQRLWHELHEHPQQLQELLHELLRRDPEQRPSAKSVIARNTWLQEHGDNEKGATKSCCTVS